MTNNSSTSLALPYGNYKGDNPAVAAVYLPYKKSIYLMIGISLVIVIFGLFVPMESAAIAKAHVVVLTNRKTVQHLEGGIVERILVKEGDIVKTGQPLIELSDIAPRASRSIFYRDLYEAQLTEARIIALKEVWEKLSFGEELSKLIASDEAIKAMADEQVKLFATQRETYLGKLEALTLRIKAANEEIGGLQAQVKSASGQLAYIEDEIGTMKRLINDGLSTKPRLLELSRNREKLRGDKGQYTAAIAKTRQNISELEVEILNLKNDFATRNSDELRETQSKISSLSEKLRAASDVVDRTTVTSPSEGIVTGLKFHTEGGVVAPGAPIMDIVPQSDELVVDARINPNDIDVVVAGLDAHIVFSAYKTRSMPRFTGKVTRVSADSFTEQQALQETAYYLAQIKVDKEQLATLANQIKLYPGMPVDVYIHTGSRSFLGYMFAPITDSLHKAFREE